MAAPIIVALTTDYVNRVTTFLQGLREVEPTPEQISEALHAAARFEDATAQPDLFGGG